MPCWSPLFPGTSCPPFPRRGIGCSGRWPQVPPGPVAETRLLLQAAPSRLGESDRPSRGGRGERPLWLEADVRPNALGKARALLYKPAEINIVTADEIGKRAHLAASCPGWPRGWSSSSSPRLERGDGPRGPHERRDQVAPEQASNSEAPGDQGEFWSHVDVSVMEIPSLPLSAIPGSLLMELGNRGHPRPRFGWNPRRGRTSSMSPEGKALLLHAPGSIGVSRCPRAPRDSAGLIRPAGRSLFRRGPHEPGVEFGVYAQWAHRRVEPLWRRYLDPVATEGDRGRQNFDVAIPDGRHRIRLSCAQGRVHPVATPRWDWSYVTGLHFVQALEK